MVHSHKHQELLVWLYDWLAYGDIPGEADLVFALAGRHSRKIQALEMFSRGEARGLLLSVGRFEIRRFDELRFPGSLDLRKSTARLRPRQRHFFVYQDGAVSRAETIPEGRFGTLREIRALRNWLEARSDIRSVTIVSSAPHLRRVRLCCLALFPASVKFRLLPVTDESSRLQRHLWWRMDKTRFAVLAEFPKLLLYWIILRFQGPPGI